jgi:hypothetical protein
VLYDQWGGNNDIYRQGIIGGELVTLPNHQPFALGFQTFSYLGPQMIPEPSGGALLVAGALCLWRAARRRAR